MASIQIDEQTASRIADIAAERGMTVEEYLRRLVERERSTPAVPLPAADFEAQLEPLLFDGPSLPADFSRADIYADHD